MLAVLLFGSRAQLGRFGRLGPAARRVLWTAFAGALIVEFGARFLVVRTHDGVSAGEGPSRHVVPTLPGVAFIFGAAALFVAAGWLAGRAEQPVLVAEAPTDPPPVGDARRVEVTQA